MYISTVDQFGGNDIGIGDRESRDLSLSVPKKTDTSILKPGKISEKLSGPPGGSCPPVEKRCSTACLRLENFVYMADTHSVSR